MRPAALIMGSIFVLLGLGIAVRDNTTYAWVLLVIGGLMMIYYGLRKRREINFEYRRRTTSGATNSTFLRPACL